MATKTKRKMVKSPLGLNIWTARLPDGGFCPVTITAKKLLGKPNGPYTVKWKTFLGGEAQQKFGTLDEALKFARNA